MKINLVKNRGITLLIIILLIVIGFAPGIHIGVSQPDAVLSTGSGAFGTLSGYVNDSQKNPIKRALVRVYFHGTYEDDYTDASGYYHVTDIPICWCMKNCTASKRGYTTDWILLSIGGDETYDFILERDDHDFVEVTTEFSGFGKQHTVHLSQQDANEIHGLIDEIKIKLDSVESRKETIKIFYEAIVELNRYGLLGGLSIEQAQELVDGRYQNPRIIRQNDREEGIFQDTNFFCLVAGHTSITVVMTPRSTLLYLLSRMNSLDEDLTSLLSNLFFISLEISTFFVPIVLLDSVFLGGKNNQGPFPHYAGAEGWIFSFGLMGKKRWNGTCYGNLPFPPLTMQLSQWEVYPGILGLTGIKICGLGSSEVFFFGAAPWIKISPSPA